MRPCLPRHPASVQALSGAHTVGRARPDRSGFGKESTKYTKVRVFDSLNLLIATC